MPRYVTSHTLACLTRQGAEELATRLFSATPVKVLRIQVSMIDGKMLVEIEADSRDALESWLKGQGFHYEWVMRVELESNADRLAPAS
jgi:hypothetical protein